MSNPRLAAHLQTISDADWCREIQSARARGRADGNAILRRIRAAVAAQEISCSGKTLDYHCEVAAPTRKTGGECQSRTTLAEDAHLGKKATAPADGVRK